MTPYSYQIFWQGNPTVCFGEYLFWRPEIAYQEMQDWFSVYFLQFLLYVVRDSSLLMLAGEPNFSWASVIFCELSQEYISVHPARSI